MFCLLTTTESRIKIFYQAAFKPSPHPHPFSGGGSVFVDSLFMVAPNVGVLCLVHVFVIQYIVPFLLSWWGRENFLVSCDDVVDWSAVCDCGIAFFSDLNPNCLSIC